uniref:Uncharacterized protein n=1 Tax=Mycena chlorophos TaxID=658473 RepID=A0ABQ0LNZ8_MYCCL|nr:predicted protein [Mycena chlorophos]
MQDEGERTAVTSTRDMAMAVERRRRAMTRGFALPNVGAETPMPLTEIGASLSVRNAHPDALPGPAVSTLTFSNSSATARGCFPTRKASAFEERKRFPRRDSDEKNKRR